MYKPIKRIIDFIIALVLLIICLPIMAIISIVIKIESKGPVLFKQERVGKKGKIFIMYKFRSMCVGAENMGTGQYSFKGDSRVTKVGKVLRATSLDEIPQLFNIIKGEMSFIGPRPTLTYHPWNIEDYTEEQFKRFDVLPGITGNAQVHGRKDLEWNKRIELDVFYVENISLFFDIKIIFLTVYNVLLGKDNENTTVTVTKNKGKENTKC